jgi:DNA mismatch repair protein MutL
MSMDDASDIRVGPPRRVAVLPDHIANKIAAGEVIQRPESVVKELVENALDAGAQTLHVIIKNGGCDLVQVIDDGCGMDEQDAVTSFLRHATSKIVSYEELEAIRTYGFRGEALASIAAVAQVSMVTRRLADEMAVSVRVDASGHAEVSREARAAGTTVTVSNLFFNVPARRKFLKSTSTEFRHVHDVLVRTALSHPDLTLDFVSDAETIFRLRPSTLEQRIVDLFGQRTKESLLAVGEETEFLAVSGYVGKPMYGQKTRAHQYLFLNGRFIVSRNIAHAVMGAYEHLLGQGSFPFFVLFLQIDPHRVDVNVHPSKMEAKFDDEQGIYRFMGALVRKALGAAGAVPGMSVFGGESSRDPVGLRFTPAQHSGGAYTHPREPWSFPERVNPSTGEIFSTGQGSLLPDAEQGEGLGAQSLGGDSDQPGPLLWQLHNTYILSQIKNGLMIVDQHVAHERVLYERALDRFQRGMRSSQQLLFPCTAVFTPADYSLIEEIFPHLEGLGFDIKPFGRNTVMIEGVPTDVRPGNEQSILEEILALYKDYRRDAPTDVRDNLAKSFSCRSAIKAGDPLTEQEMRSLIDQLFATRMPYVCPHGRPVVLRIPTEELDRRFGRR